MSEDIEGSVLSALLRDPIYASKAILHLEEEYFERKEAKVVFSEVSSHFETYKAVPSKVELAMRVTDLVGKIPDDVVGKTKTFIEQLPTDLLVDTQYMLDRTNTFIQRRALFIAIGKAVEIIDGHDKKLSIDGLPEMLKNALAKGLDTTKVYDYFDMAAERWAEYTKTVDRYKMRIDIFNKITRGGLFGGTLTLLCAGTNIGKSAMLCAFTADFLAEGYDVLYISNEMNETMISERIDSNLLSMPIDELKTTTLDFFTGAIARARRSRAGTLKIHSYPTRTASVKHFRALMKNLQDKENFKPKVIILDYLNNCLPATVRTDSNSYERVKAIAEEVRGLAMEFNVPVLSATQLNRGGQNSSNVKLDDISESHGTSQTADWMWALIRPEDMQASQQILIKQLKNRHGDIGKYSKFVIGFDFSRMTMYETEDQSGAASGPGAKLADDLPVFDETKSGIRLQEEIGGGGTFNFSG